MTDSSPDVLVGPLPRSSVLSPPSPTAPPDDPFHNPDLTAASISSWFSHGTHLRQILESTLSRTERAVCSLSAHTSKAEKSTTSLLSSPVLSLETLSRRNYSERGFTRLRTLQQSLRNAENLLKTSTHFFQPYQPSAVATATPTPPPPSPEVDSPPIDVAVPPVDESSASQPQPQLQPQPQPQLQLQVEPHLPPLPHLSTSLLNHPSVRLHTSHVEKNGILLSDSVRKTLHRLGQIETKLGSMGAGLDRVRENGEDVVADVERGLWEGLNIYGGSVSVSECCSWVGIEGIADEVDEIMPGRDLSELEGTDQEECEGEGGEGGGEGEEKEVKVTTVGNSQQQQQQPQPRYCCSTCGLFFTQNFLLMDHIYIRHPNQVALLSAQDNDLLVRLLALPKEELEYQRGKRLDQEALSARHALDTLKKEEYALRMAKKKYESVVEIPEEAEDSVEDMMAKHRRLGTLKKLGVAVDGLKMRVTELKELLDARRVVVKLGRVEKRQVTRRLEGMQYRRDLAVSRREKLSERLVELQRLNQQLRIDRLASEDIRSLLEIQYNRKRFKTKKGRFVLSLEHELKVVGRELEDYKAWKTAEIRERDWAERIDELQVGRGQEKLTRMNARILAIRAQTEDLRLEIERLRVKRIGIEERTQLEHTGCIDMSVVADWETRQSRAIRELEDQLEATQAEINEVRAPLDVAKRDLVLETRANATSRAEFAECQQSLGRAKAKTARCNSRMEEVVAKIADLPPHTRRSPSPSGIPPQWSSDRKFKKVQYVGEEASFGLKQIIVRNERLQLQKGPGDSSSIHFLNIHNIARPVESGSRRSRVYQVELYETRGDVGEHKHVFVFEVADDADRFHRLCHKLVDLAKDGQDTTKLDMPKVTKLKVSDERQSTHRRSNTLSGATLVRSVVSRLRPSSSRPRRPRQPRAGPESQSKYPSRRRKGGGPSKEGLASRFARTNSEVPASHAIDPHSSTAQLVRVMRDSLPKTSPAQDAPGDV